LRGGSLYLASLTIEATPLTLEAASCLHLLLKVGRHRAGGVESWFNYGTTRTKTDSQATSLSA